MDNGLSVALMGIDGAGKSTLVAALRGTLAAGGREVVPVTWEAAVSELGGDRSAYPLATLETLGVEGWRLMYADLPAYRDIPGWLADHGAREMIGMLPVDPVGGRQSALVTSALIEMTGHQLLQAEVVVPALARGAVTVCDGFGFKNVLKVLRMAQLVPGPVPAASVELLIRHAREVFGGEFMRPRVGLLLDADPALTYGWRIGQRDRLGPVEDLSLAGRPGRESYLEFQSALAAEFRSVAASWGWHALPVDGRPQDRTIAEALDVVLLGTRPAGAAAR